MENNRKLSASCLVIKDNQILLVKHTYGAAKGKYLIPGGFSEEGEMPQTTAEREVNIVTTTQELIKSALTDKPVLQKSAFANSNYAPNTWQLFI